MRFHTFLGCWMGGFNENVDNSAEALTNAGAELDNKAVCWVDGG